MAVKLKGAPICLEELSSLQSDIEAIPGSSDSVVRQVSAVLNQTLQSSAGLVANADSVLIPVSYMKTDIVETRSSMRHLTTPQLPKDCHLHYKNMVNQLVVPERSPFWWDILRLCFHYGLMIRCNTSILEVPSQPLQQRELPSRCNSDDQLSHCADFVPRYLVKVNSLL
ncbi:hypothetical protein Y032_0164g3541 [Ancylostoma ceylanicum]|uniref:Uncharacterized protein n=1 Tax=Ancylostoma ceylanicum TaxID=53326 RepID=A0A016SXM4_9BILA|nr:hypothetical protein Y032_0164g3541 [Ancylostoma ceylanicum]